MTPTVADNLFLLARFLGCGCMVATFWIWSTAPVNRALALRPESGVGIVVVIAYFVRFLP